MSKPKYITSVTYEINAQTEKGRFTIPVEVRTALNIVDESTPLHLHIIDVATKEVLYDNKAIMTSGPEILNEETRIKIASKQLIRVTVERKD